jgi:hypothetical protein
MVRLALASLAVAAIAAAADQPSAVTFTKDVLPILQKNCPSCHRPGQLPRCRFSVTPIVAQS